MIVNLGLVELGGDPIEIPDPDFKLDGYIFKFADGDPTTGEVRTFFGVKKLTGYYERKHAELRIFVNYDWPEFLALVVKWMTIHKDHFSSVAFLFKSGNVIVL